MKTKHALLILAAAATLASCTNTIPATGPNPLDTPGAQPTAKDLRAYHMEKITGNPTFHLR